MRSMTRIGHGMVSMILLAFRLSRIAIPRVIGADAASWRNDRTFLRPQRTREIHREPLQDIAYGPFRMRHTIVCLYA